jgi:hypothetical protein
MIQQKPKNNRITVSLRESYILINIIFAGVILLIMAYSGFFSPVKDNYPVICIHEKLTGIPCASCGLSHSFSLILRGNVSEALKWNVYGLRVFLFFALQLVLRISFSAYYLSYPQNRRGLILTDAVGSGIMFFVAFWPYMRWIAVQLVN